MEKRDLYKEPPILIHYTHTNRFIQRSKGIYRFYCLNTQKSDKKLSPFTKKNNSFVDKHNIKFVGKFDKKGSLLLYLGVFATVTTFTRFTPPPEETETIVGDPFLTPSRSESDSELRGFNFMSRELGIPAAEDWAR